MRKRETESERVSESERNREGELRKGRKRENKSDGGKDRK